MAITALLVAKSLKRERIFQDRQNPMEMMTNDMVLARYRFPKTAIIDLLKLVAPQIVRATQRNNAIPPIIQLLTALRFYATGSFFYVDGDVHGISRSSVSRVMQDVSTILGKLAVDTIKFPSTANEQDEVKQGFYEMSKFPRVIGAIDCTHIQIKTPKENEVVKWPGSTHDAFVLAQSNIATTLAAGVAGDGWLLGDSGYPLRSWLLTPFLNPGTGPERRFNKAQKRCRCTIERVFGVLKSRFRCLDKTGGGLQFVPEKCVKVILSCFYLHNLAKQMNLPDDDEDRIQQVLLDEFDDEVNVNGVPSGTDVRNAVLITYFS
ncbi:unnamed protein product [Didymodactylos carnosus]|uniref:Putative nuclease HARBI1 n=1 Tax=Didymodactylos carnosus TaxID=1234261 RepID=A0A814D6Y6_9BILA|nr:unnamed protein product [Didymodactylos carnosus]CAF3725014.1 unnamed protein product [Didymodactylos carnosus]